MKMKVPVFPRALGAAEAGALSEPSRTPPSSSEEYFLSNDQRTALRAQSAPRCADTRPLRSATACAQARAREGGGWRGEVVGPLPPRRAGGSPARCRAAGAASGGGGAAAARVGSGPGTASARCGKAPSASNPPASAGCAAGKKRERGVGGGKLQPERCGSHGGPGRHAWGQRRCSCSPQLL